jgi:hypothetical protein
MFLVPCLWIWVSKIKNDLPFIFNHKNQLKIKTIYDFKDKVSYIYILTYYYRAGHFEFYSRRTFGPFLSSRQLRARPNRCRQQLGQGSLY